MNIEEVGDPPGPGDVVVVWLGQSGVFVRDATHSIVIDPYLSDSLTVKYARTDTPHVRLHPRVIAPEALARAPIDVVFATHHHTDHLDPDTLAPLLGALDAEHRPAPLVAPEAWRDLAAARARIPVEAVIGLDEGQSAAINGVSVTAVGSTHDAPNHDDRGRRRCLGYVIRLSSTTLYHSGDAMYDATLAERLRPFGIDIGFLPINGKVGNMSGAEAARFAHAAGMGLVIPCHYDMFAFNTADPATEFEPACRTLAQPYRVLTMGAPFTWRRAGASF